MRAVLDTNVLLSALLFPGGSPDLAFKAALQGKYELVLSPFILQELTRILEEKFDYPADEAVAVAEFVRDVASLVVEPSAVPQLISPKKDDNHILACAVQAQADYLVTGDMRHIYPLGRIGETRIVSPAEFLRELEKG